MFDLLKRAGETITRLAPEGIKPYVPYVPSEHKFVDYHGWDNGYVAYCWLQVVPPSIEDEEFYIEPLATGEIGSEPWRGATYPWLACEIDNDGWEVFLSNCHDYRANGDVMTFALEEGIAPFQPFLVKVRAPRYSSTWEGDYDADYYPAEVVAKAPLEAYEVAARWADAFFWRYQYVVSNSIEYVQPRQATFLVLGDAYSHEKQQ